MSGSTDLRRRLGSAATSEKETTICCYCGRDGVIAVACIWMVCFLSPFPAFLFVSGSRAALGCLSVQLQLFSSVMVVAASYWLYLVHEEEAALAITLPSLTSADAANGRSASFTARAQKFFQLPSDGEFSDLNSIRFLIRWGYAGSSKSL